MFSKTAVLMIKFSLGHVLFSHFHSKYQYKNHAITYFIEQKAFSLKSKVLIMQKVEELFVLASPECPVLCAWCCRTNYSSVLCASTP